MIKIGNIYSVKQTAPHWQGFTGKLIKLYPELKIALLEPIGFRFSMAIYLLDLITLEIENENERPIC